MALTPGARLGPYEVVAAIGAGGMGEVYRARDTRLDRAVAVKVLPPQFNADPERHTRFIREAKTISALNHPHICALYDVGEAVLQSSGSLVPSPVSVSFLVMEYLEGETLASRLDRGSLPLEQALRVGADVAVAPDGQRFLTTIRRTPPRRLPGHRGKAALRVCAAGRGR